MKRFAAISCSDDEKWGKSEGIVKRYEDFYRIKDEEWTGFHATRGNVPTIEDLEKFDAFLISGSISSANDNKEWILKLKEFIQALVSLDKAKKRPKLVGICFGHQLIGSTLGGQVGPNPSKDFILHAEEIVGNEAASKVKGLEGLFDNGPLRLLESHGECLTELPDGAINLASSSSCKQELVKFSDNILGLQSHPDMLKEEVQNLILPAISKKFNWSDEKIKEIEASVNMKLHPDKMNEAIKKFIQN
ncbi:gamma-glutamyl peptidase 5-like [Actinia tenebrosa]|uniref:Gamma-glutamyl peptidase 5-like n=1 Tax=Actinia tenebrosa TaxID=6105 RepID=A0A6P8I8S2_ACTTE|nr:gamma-glutamyl peptidase 5-like [Actinia tenebrosa]